VAVLISKDGFNWNETFRISQPPFLATNTLCSNGTGIFVAGNGAIWYTADGISFTPIFPKNFITGHHWSQLSIPQIGGPMYADGLSVVAIGTGLLVSNNGGVAWNNLGMASCQYNQPLYFLSKDDTILLAGGGYSVCVQTADTSHLNQWNVTIQEYVSGTGPVTGAV
jgi:hypothetical protein